MHSVMNDYPGRSAPKAEYGGCTSGWNSTMNAAAAPPIERQIRELSPAPPTGTALGLLRGRTPTTHGVRHPHPPPVAPADADSTS